MIQHGEKGDLGSLSFDYLVFPITKKNACTHAQSKRNSVENNLDFLNDLLIIGSILFIIHPRLPLIFGLCTIFSFLF